MTTTTEPAGQAELLIGAAQHLFARRGNVQIRDVTEAVMTTPSYLASHQGGFA